MVEKFGGLRVAAHHIEVETRAKTAWARVKVTEKLGAFGKSLPPTHPSNEEPEPEPEPEPELAPSTSPLSADNQTRGTMQEIDAVMSKYSTESAHERRDTSIVASTGTASLAEIEAAMSKYSATRSVKPTTVADSKATNP